jgi:hypothetical protein
MHGLLGETFEVGDFIMPYTFSDRRSGMYPVCLVVGFTKKMVKVVCVEFSYQFSQEQGKYVNVAVTSNKNVLPEKCVKMNEQVNQVYYSDYESLNETQQNLFEKVKMMEKHNEEH